MSQGEEELESFLEQHRRAMSASRERESQIRWEQLFVSLFHPFVYFLEQVGYFQRRKQS